MAHSPAQGLIRSFGTKENGVPAGALVEPIRFGRSLRCWDLLRTNGTSRALACHCTSAQPDDQEHAHADCTSHVRPVEQLLPAHLWSGPLLAYVLAAKCYRPRMVAPLGLSWLVAQFLTTLGHAPSRRCSQAPDVEPTPAATASLEACTKRLARVDTPAWRPT